MKYDTVIWDLDGTLLDTLEDLADAANAALAAFGCPPRSLAEIRSMVGNGVSRLMLRALPEDRKGDHAGALEAFRASYGAHYADKTRPYPGIPEALDALKARGVAMAVVSNKLEPVTKALCRRCLGGRIGVVIGDREGMRRKPAPDSVNLALAQLGRDRTRAVYIGDSEVDIATARSAGLPCISVGWGFRPAQVLYDAGAREIIPDVDALLGLLLEEGS